MKKKKIVVLGGGFAGIYTARNLARSLKNKAEIIVIDKRNYFLFTPLLHEVATATIDDKVAVESIASLVSKEKLIWKVGKVQKVFTKKKIVKLDNFSQEYDYLVVSIGTTVNTYGIEGVEENAYRLKNLADAINLKHALIEKFQLAAISDSVKEKKKLLTFTIVGAGPTGIELAGEISDLARDIAKNYFHTIDFEDVTLNIINSSEAILPHHNPKLGKWVEQYLIDNNWKLIANCRVSKVGKESIEFNDGSKMFSGLTIWTAGVKPNVIDFDVKLDLENGRIPVSDSLAVKGLRNVYALGDIAAHSPMLAQVAVQQASVVAANIYRKISQKKGSKKFKFNNKGFLVSVGKWKAVGEIYGFAVRGWWVWILWHGIYFFKFISHSKRIKVLLDWSLNVFRSRDISSY
jgi:NADH dehydrogenase